MPSRPAERLRRLLVQLVAGHEETLPGGTVPPVKKHTGPLAGIRVLDMSAVISGPWAASIIADQGADVIKVEGPSRPDTTRTIGPTPLEVPGMASMYMTANRGKRCITLDVQRPEGVAVLKRLVAYMDVVIQNYRPGVAERLGVDYASLCTVNPDVILLSISGYGSSGPYIEGKVYDQVIQAMSGVGAIMQDKQGLPSMFHNLLMDKVTALHAAQSITAALLAKKLGRGGQHIELSMIDSAVHFLFPDGYMNKVWKNVDPWPVEFSFIQRSCEYVAADGKVALICGNADELTGLLNVAGLSRLRDSDPDWQQVRAASISAIRENLSKMPKQLIFDQCLKNNVPCGMFQTHDEVMLDEQVQHNQIIQERHHPLGGEYRTPLPPARFSTTPSAVGDPSPSMGAHNDEVLHEFGFSTAEISALRDARLIGK